MSPQRATIAAGFVIAALACSGCSHDAESPRSDAITEWTQFSMNGVGLGQLRQPRAIAAASEDRVTVIDRTGRVQTFDLSRRGESASTSPSVDLRWLPEWKNGQPVDCSYAPDGSLIVGDTHYGRVLSFSPERDAGPEVVAGRGAPAPYDLELVRGIARAPDGRIYCSEYQSHDRIVVFSAEGEFLRTIGATGDGPGEFRRPEGLEIANDQLYVVDCGHHRIQVFSLDGEFRFSFGSEGAGPGEFLFPYDIAAGSHGALYVVDFRGNRLQRFGPDGEFDGACGSSGSGEDEFATPRGVACAVTPTEDVVFVADTNNHRVHRIRWTPWRASSSVGSER